MVYSKVQLKNYIKKKKAGWAEYQQLAYYKQQKTKYYESRIKTRKCI